MIRSALKRTPLRRLGSRKRRELPALIKFRADVLKLAKGRCARCGKRRADHELEAHHLVGRGRGAGWAHLHDAGRNGAALCGGVDRCHALVTAHAVADWPQWIRSARGSGR